MADTSDLVVVELEKPAPKPGIVTDRPVNAGQLAGELAAVADLGDGGLRVAGPDADGLTRVYAADVDDAIVANVVDRHVADPSWQPPPEELPPDPVADARTRLEELRAKADAGDLTAADAVDAMSAMLIATVPPPSPPPTTRPGRRPR